jgi:hypothetical protein
MSTTVTPADFTTLPQELPGRIHIVLVRQMVGF